MVGLAAQACLRGSGRLSPRLRRWQPLPHASAQGRLAAGLLAPVTAPDLFQTEGRDTNARTVHKDTAAPAAAVAIKARCVCGATVAERTGRRKRTCGSQGLGHLLPAARPAQLEKPAGLLRCWASVAADSRADARQRSDSVACLLKRGVCQLRPSLPVE